MYAQLLLADHDGFTIAVDGAGESHFCLADLLAIKEIFDGKSG